MRLNINLRLEGVDADMLVASYAGDVAPADISRRSSITKLKICVSMLLANVLFYKTVHIYYNRNKLHDIPAKSIYNTSSISPKLIRRSIDIGDGVLWENFIAPPEIAKQKRRASYFTPAKELLEVLQSSYVEAVEHPDAVKCYLKASKTKYQDYRTDQHNDIAKINAQLKQLSSRANEANWSFVPLFYVDEENRILLPSSDRQQLKVNLIRVYHGDFCQQGRIWGGIDNLSRAERSTLQVGGDDTVEIDWSAAHITLLYSIAGQTLVGDPYDIEGLSRDEAKLISLRAMNNSSLHAAVGSVRKHYWEAFNKELNYAEASQALQLFTARHSVVADYLFSKEYSAMATLLESNIMFEAMMQCYKQGIDALSIHDGCRCRVKDESAVRKLLDDACRAYSVEPLQVAVDDCGQGITIEDDNYLAEIAI